tara:strand:- start:45 stop:689 length:645 start_codon:yes stop_codon:yes gene_type:complete
MKKLLSIFVASIISLSGTSALAEIGVGVTGNMLSLETSGSQTLKHTGGITSTSITEDVVIPEVFIEVIADSGAAVGISYVDAQSLGKKSRTDTDIATATNTAEAELDSHAMVYVDVPVYSVAGQAVYVKAGISNTTLVTKEVLGTGSTYGDMDIMGYSAGLGFKGDLPMMDNMYYKVEGLYTEFEKFKASSATENAVKADVEATSIKLSVGYKF